MQARHHRSDRTGELVGSFAIAALVQVDQTQDLALLRLERGQILYLIDLNERSYREAAHELACPIGTVMSRLHRARRALRAQLDAAAVRA